MGVFRRDVGDDGGFTLVELMVVVLVIAILIAVAIPTFLGARTRAQDRAAQSELRNALTAAKIVFTDTGSFTTTPAELEDIEPSIDFDLMASASTDVVGLVVEDVVAADDDDWIITFATQSGSSTWFCISDTASGGATGTFYDEGPTLADVDAAADCTGPSW